MYLLDTDTCIHLARGNPLVLAKLRAQHRADIYVSILSNYELEFGLQKAVGQKKAKRKALDDLVQLLSIAPFDHAEALESARIRHELEKKGTPIGSIDTLIAGTARANGWTVVTGNLGEFRRIKGLKSESWHREE